MDVLLLHGLFGFRTVPLGPVRVEYFKGIVEALQAAGHSVTTTAVNPVGSIEQRAGQLQQQIAQHVADLSPNQQVLLIAHSMGGLDARHLLATAPAPLAARVASLVTIATPHRGSPVADLAVRIAKLANPLHLPDPLHAVGGIVGGTAEHLGLPAQLVPPDLTQALTWLGSDHDAIADLTTSSCMMFNQATPNRPGVACFWIGCDCSAAVPPFFKPTFELIAHDTGVSGGGKNDGFVSLASAEPPADVANPWQGLGIWTGVDHAGAVNIPASGNFAQPDVAPRYVQIVATVQAALGA